MYCFAFFPWILYTSIVVCIGNKKWNKLLSIRCYFVDSLLSLESLSFSPEWKLNEILETVLHEIISHYILYHQ